MVERLVIRSPCMCKLATMPEDSLHADILRNNVQDADHARAQPAGDQLG